MGKQDDCASKEEMLPANHYRLFVTYSPMPSVVDLKSVYGEENVLNIFDKPFHRGPFCLNTVFTRGEKIFYLHDAGDDWEYLEQMAWGKKQSNAVAPYGYRPATHKETFEFFLAHPELVNYVGFGTFTMNANLEYVMIVWPGKGGRFLGAIWCGVRWPRQMRILFVCN